MRCPRCGLENMDDEIYCLKCGEELKPMGKDASNTFPCPYCGTENYDTANECKSCHNQIQSPYAYCAHCGRKNLASDSVCRECDSPLPNRLAQPTPSGAIPPPETLACPSCGKPMEKGFIIAPDKDSLHRVRWSASGDLIWQYAGVPIPLGDQVPPNMNVPAFRCPACKLVLMRY